MPWHPCQTAGSRPRPFEVLDAFAPVLPYGVDEQVWCDDPCTLLECLDARQLCLYQHFDLRSEADHARVIILGAASI